MPAHWRFLINSSAKINKACNVGTLWLWHMAVRGYYLETQVRLAYARVRR